jgi:DHA2 family multidrug resistance protein
MAMTRVDALTGFFQKLGASAHDARFRAFSAIDQILNGQAALKSFDDLFAYVGIAFVVTLPLVLFLGGGGNKAVAAEAH